MSIADDDTLHGLALLDQMRKPTLQGTTVADSDEPDGLDELDELDSFTGNLDGPPRIGHYLLLDKLGEGGMGVVYAAYDPKLERKVALKLLRAGGDRKARKRMRREAQAMARLSHPNVVQIYEIGELGEHDPLLFIVMEFIAGQTLRQWLTEPDHSDSELLDVFFAAGRGLAAAHTQGLVHRDFKPDNVMLRNDGRVLVMDFGLARADSQFDPELDESLNTSPDMLIEPSGVTATGAVLGTPAYMAPEQFEAATTDARTDQFSFCVALWEALHGQRPFRADSLAELSELVCTGQIVSPPSHEVPGWLRSVLSRGLKVDPNQRWPSMDALLVALRDDPSARRHRRFALAGVAVALVAIVAGLGINQNHNLAQRTSECEAAGQAIREQWNPAVEAALATTFAESGLDYAPATWRRVSRAIEDYTKLWSQVRTQACFDRYTERAAASNQAEIVTCLDERRATMGALLEVWAQPDARIISRAMVAANSLESIETCSTQIWLNVRTRVPAPVREQVRAVRAELEHVAGLAYAGNYEQGLALCEPLLLAAEELQWRPLVAEVQFRLAKLHDAMGDYESARASAEQAYLAAVAGGHEALALDVAAMLASLLGDRLVDHERGMFWASLAQMHVERLGLEHSIFEAEVMSSLGHVELRASNLDAALAAFESSLAIFEAAYGSEHLTTSNALNELGVVYRSRGDYPRALELYERSAAMREAVLGPDHPLVATSHHNIGVIEWQRGNYDAALAALRPALAIREAALGQHPGVSMSYNAIGAVLAAQHDTNGALAHFERALAIDEATLGPDHADLAGSLTNVGNIQRRLGRAEEALASHQRALAIWEASLEPDHPYIAMALNNIGVSYEFEGQFEQALEFHRRALAVRVTALGPEHPDVAMSESNISSALGHLGQFEQALEHSRHALVIREAALGPDHDDTAQSLDTIGLLLVALGRTDEALDYHRRALAIIEVALGPESIDAGRFWSHIGTAELERAQLGPAANALERALEIFAKHEDTPLSSLSQAQLSQAQLLHAQGDARGVELARATRDQLHARGAPYDDEESETLAQLEAWLSANPN